MFKSSVSIAVMAAASLASWSVLAEEPDLRGLRGTVLEPPPDVTDKPALFMDKRPVLEGALSRQAARGRATDDHEPAGLRGSVASSIANSLSLRATRHEADAAHRQIRRARAAFLPTITATGEANETKNLSGIETSRPGRKTGFAVEMSMSLFASGRDLQRLKGAKNASKAADHQYLSAEQRVAYDGIVAFLNLHLNREAEKAIERNLIATRKIVRALKGRFKAGVIGRTDVAIGKAELHLLASELSSASEQRIASEIAYRSLTGKSAPGRTALPNIRSIMPASADVAIRSGLTRNPDILAAEYRARAAANEANATLANYLPQASINARYGMDVYHRRGITDTESSQVGVRLSVPLFDADVAPAFKQSKHQANAAHYRALDVRRGIEREIRTSWTTYTQGQRRSEILAMQIAELGKAVIGTQKEYEAGFRPITDVLDRRIAMTRAEIELASSLTATATAAYRIYMTSGKLSLDRSLY